MAFVDMAYLRKSDVHGGLLTYARRKTGQLLHIRVEECMQRIIAQYAPLACSGYLFPIIGSLDPGRAYLSYRSALSYYNKHLKELSACSVSNAICLLMSPAIPGRPLPVRCRFPLRSSAKGWVTGRSRPPKFIWLHWNRA